MKAGVFHGPRDVVVEEVAEPDVPDDGIVLEVGACGICGSDVHLFDHGGIIRPGQVMGHEFAGRVVAVGPAVSGLAIGDRVAAMPLLPCGVCRACRAGAEQQCVRAFRPGIGFGLPGAFAERVALPQARLGHTVFALADHVSFEAGALAEPVAVAAHAVRLSGAGAQDTAVVLGLGPIGQLVARVLRAAGVGRVLGVERSDFRRARAAAVGLTVVADVEDVGDALGADPPVDVVFECTGVPALAQRAAKLVRRGGTVVIVASYLERAPIDVSGFVLSELTIRGSSAYAVADFAAAVALLEAGTIAPGELVTDHAALGDLGGELERQLQAGTALKVMVAP